MDNCQDNSRFFPPALWEGLKNIPALRYLKAPVDRIEHLYRDYPTGAEKGAFAFVHDENTFYTYHPRGWNRGRWKPIAGGIESFFEIDIEFLEEGDTLVYDSQKQKFVVKSGNIWNKLTDKASSIVQTSKFFNEAEEIPTEESDAGIYFIHKDNESDEGIIEFRALYIVLNTFVAKKVVKIWNSSDYKTKIEVDAELSKKANQTQVDDIAASVDVLAVTKAEKSVVDAMQQGTIKQKAVDTYNDTSEGKISLASVYGLTAQNNGTNGKPKQNGWDVLIRSDETKGGISNRYNWNGESWIDLETGNYPQDVALSGGSDKTLLDVDREANLALRQTTFNSEENIVKIRQDRYGYRYNLTPFKSHTDNLFIAKIGNQPLRYHSEGGYTVICSMRIPVQEGEIYSITSCVSNSTPVVIAYASNFIDQRISGKDVSEEAEFTLPLDGLGIKVDKGNTQLYKKVDFTIPHNVVAIEIQGRKSNHKLFKVGYDLMIEKKESDSLSEFNEQVFTINAESHGFWSDSNSFIQGTIGLDSEFEETNLRIVSREFVAINENLEKMGDVSTLEELETKEKKAKHSYFVLDQLSEDDKPYIYKYNQQIDKWINTKRTDYDTLSKKGSLFSASVANGYDFTVICFDANKSRLGHTGKEAWTRERVDEEFLKNTVFYRIIIRNPIGKITPNNPHHFYSESLSAVFWDRLVTENTLKNFKANNFDSEQIKDSEKIEAPDSYSGLDLSAEYIYSLFDKLLGNYTGYPPSDGLNKDKYYRVTKKNMGKDQSNTYDIYMYDFMPIGYSKTVFFTCLLHGTEVSTPIAMYELLSHMVLQDVSSPVLRYMRENVRLLILPVANPWGATNKKYGNINGVNPNRNYPYYWNEYVSSETIWDVKGSAAFSEKETQIIRDIAIANAGNLDFMIDYHTGESWNNEPFFYHDKTDHFLTPALFKAAKKITENYKKEMGKIPVPETKETARDLKVYWFNRCLGVPCATIEFSPDLYSNIANDSKQITALMFNYLTYWTELFSLPKFTSKGNIGVEYLTENQYNAIPAKSYKKVYILTDKDNEKRIGDIKF